MVKDMTALQDKDLPKEADLEYALNYLLRLTDNYGCRCPELMAAMQALFRFTDGEYDTFNKSQVEGIYNTLKAIDEKITEKAL